MRQLLAWLALVASGSVLSAQEPGRAVDVSAEDFRRIAESRDSLPDAARARWLYAVFDTATRSYRRDQPLDTVIDASGVRAIYRRLRRDWDQGDAARWESALEALQTIDKTRLNERDALSHDLMHSEATRKLGMARGPQLYLPLTNNRGPHHSVWFYGSEWLPSETLADYEVVLAHLNGIPLEIDGMIEGMRQAHAEGMMPPQVLVTNVRDALGEMIVDDPMASGYLAKFVEFPASITAPDQARLRASAERIYRTGIRPAYERLLSYAADDYLPAATRDASFSALPGGTERYELLLRLRTAPAPLSPARLHRRALDDVARSAAVMDSVRVAVGFQGSYREFLEFLRSDSRFEFADSAAYVRAARAVAERIDANIDRLFHTIPRIPFGIAGAPGIGVGTYLRGVTKTTPGTVRLFIGAARTWRLHAMMLHEAVPGHHFSHAVFLERGLPAFRGLGSQSAFTEGWALYAESMGTELGLYDEEYSVVGRVVGELWRAIRAVLDTGVNGLGWTHEEAVRYARQNSVHTDAQIEGELNRMMTNPGFVLSYKLGQWKFQELRAFAERELGSSFEVRAFHDALLEHGEMPLDVLDSHMRAWVARQRSSSG